MQPFNLDRFKAGEPAYHKDTHKEFFYFGDLPGGRIAIKFLNHDVDVWVCYSLSIQIANDLYYMKEKELTWDYVYNMWVKDKSDSTNFYRWLDENLEPPKRKKK